MNDLLKFITCGSVDDGKSTLIGHLLYDAKLIYADQEKALLLDSKVGSRGGAIDYSLLLDGLLAEREQGITIDVAYRYFTTDNRSFICADTPGHEEYTRNMACGASFADLAVILVDATQGVLTQTRRHARICALMGIRYFVFAINKMDLVGYSEQRFKEIEAQIAELQQELHLHDVKLIPVSATEGDNVTKKSPNMTWYDGPTLLDYLEQVDVSAVQEEGFYMPVQRVCRPNHEFRGFQGQIESGSIAIGDTVTSQPSGEEAQVKKILVADREAESAFKGQPVTIQLNREVDVSRGCVLEKGSHVRQAANFKAEILWMDDVPLTIGKNFMVFLGTKKIPGILTKIDYRIDINTGEHVEATGLKKNEIAVCEIAVTEPIVLDTFDHHRTQGELILIDRISNMTAACGVVREIPDASAKRHFAASRCAAHSTGRPRKPLPLNPRRTASRSRPSRKPSTTSCATAATPTSTIRGRARTQHRCSVICFRQASSSCSYSITISRCQKAFRVSKSLPAQRKALIPSRLLQPSCTTRCSTP